MSKKLDQQIFDIIYKYFIHNNGSQNYKDHVFLQKLTECVAHSLHEYHKFFMTCMFTTSIKKDLDNLAKELNLIIPVSVNE